LTRHSGFLRVKYSSIAVTLLSSEALFGVVEPKKKRKDYFFLGWEKKQKAQPGLFFSTEMSYKFEVEKF